MKRHLLIGIVALALIAPGVLMAQGDLTLEDLAAQVEGLTSKVAEIFTTQDDLAQRLAAVETAIAPTPTATAPLTETPTSTHTATASPSPTPLSADPSLTIQHRMNVRRGPGTHHDIIGTAEPGTEFAITGKNLNGDWWQIDYEGQAGWVYAPYVTASDVDGVQVVATPLPTSTPVPSAGDDIGSTEAAAALLLADFLYEPSAWQRLTEAQQGAVVIVYQSLLEFAADHCVLSYEDAALLVDSYGDILDEARFTSVDGSRPRGYLLSFLWGFAKDGIEELEAAGVDCDYILELGVYAALAE